jgi:hypothetical protein
VLPADDVAVGPPVADIGMPRLGHEDPAESLLAGLR